MMMGAVACSSIQNGRKIFIGRQVSDLYFAVRRPEPSWLGDTGVRRADQGVNMK
jgi:hypothetical protein